MLVMDRFSGVRDLRKLLDLGPHKRVEILVTSSGSGISRVGPKDASLRAKRILVPSGDLAGVADLSVMLSRAYPRKTFIITPSARTRVDRNADNFVVGGPIHNEYAARLVRGDDGQGLVGLEVFMDADKRHIVFGRHELGPDLDLGFKDNVPALDYGRILLTRVATQGNKGKGTHRVLVAGGLTTYGTHAAAHFAAYQLASYAKSHGFSKAPNVYVLIKGEFVNGEPYDVRAVDHIIEAPDLSTRGRG
jgi:hypothetical protein